MISDENFRIELDGYLKKGNITKKERNKIICDYLENGEIDRDKVLEGHRTNDINKIIEIPTETAEQIDFVYKFRKRFPGVVLLSVRNDGFRTPYEKSQQVAMGLYAGASDMICPQFKMAIEMKTKKGGVQSAKQKAFQLEMIDIGWNYILAFGADDGMAKVEKIAARWGWIILLDK